MPENIKSNTETFCPASRQEWRAWLAEHHAVKQSVWLICYKKQSGKPVIPWSEAVDEALCFGWIDSTRVTIDADRFKQFFSRRKPKSIWSKINKDKVQRLMDAGLMTPAGLLSVEVARQNGMWNMMDEAEEQLIPKDLAQAFKKHKGSRQFFLSLSKSVRKAILQWLVLARRSETRQKRVAEIAELAAQHLRPKQFR